MHTGFNISMQSLTADVPSMDQGSKTNDALADLKAAQDSLKQPRHIMSRTGINIYIENPQLYTTGDTVRGSIELYVEEKLDLECIEVELLGMAKSRNHTYVNGSYVSGSERHKLIQLTSKVFPPPDVQQVSASKKFTLGSGTYHYPFLFTFPGKEHIAQCVRDKKTLHSRYYLKKDQRDQVTLVGSFFHQENSEDYCMVQYTIDAQVVVPLMFKFNIKKSEPIYFVPRNSEIFFSLRHLCDRKRCLLPDEDTTCQTVKYGIDDEAKMSKSLLKKVFSSNAIKVPFELRVKFRDDMHLETDKGKTSRVLLGGSRLSQFVELDLLTPLSREALSNALGISREGKTGAESKSPVVSITHIKIKLLLYVAFLGAAETHLKQITELLNQDVDIRTPLDAFEKIEYSGLVMAHRTPSKLLDKIDKKAAYCLKLDPSWWDCYVGDIGQSFLTCSIRKNVELYVRLTLGTPGNPEKGVKIKSSSPVIIHSQERADSTEPFPLDHQEQLPSYMPAPPDYESDSDRKLTDKKQ